ncbi:hypothetical protein [Bacillus sp. JJ1122]|uniref:hypothetical protein n=1 Tax=Bacillus sp. JJ1122 TaxID=3122951 RepID=UPI002FFD5F4D
MAVVSKTFSTGEIFESTGEILGSTGELLNLTGELPFSAEKVTPTHNNLATGN